MRGENGAELIAPRCAIEDIDSGVEQEPDRLDVAGLIDVSHGARRGPALGVEEVHRSPSSRAECVRSIRTHHVGVGARVEQETDDLDLAGERGRVQQGHALVARRSVRDLPPLASLYAAISAG